MWLTLSSRRDSCGNNYNWSQLLSPEERGWRLIPIQMTGRGSVAQTGWKRGGLIRMKMQFSAKKKKKKGNEKGVNIKERTWKVKTNNGSDIGYGWMRPARKQRMKNKCLTRLNMKSRLLLIDFGGACMCVLLCVHMYAQNKHYRPHIIKASLIVETFGVKCGKIFLCIRSPQKITPRIVCVSQTWNSLFISCRATFDCFFVLLVIVLL